MFSDSDAREGSGIGSDPGPAAEPGSGSGSGAEPAAATLPISSNEDVMAARQAVRAAAVAAGFSLIEQTKIVTAASELARNCYVHGGGGSLRIENVSDGTNRGLRLTVWDEGPGIRDVDTALTDGYSSEHGPGYGLGGTRRLMDEFSLESEPGQGTTVTITRWATSP